MVRTLLAYIAAVVTTAVLGSVAHTHFVLAELSRLGVEISMPIRIETVFHDIVNMGLNLFAVVVAAGFLVAFVIAAVIIRFVVPGWRMFGYPLAGAVAMGTALTLMSLQFNGATPIAGARSDLGFAMQCLAGAMGGLVFALIAPTGKRRD